MSKENILYSCVADQATVLSEFSIRSGNFKEIVFRLLSNVDSTVNNQMSFAFQKYVSRISAIFWFLAIISTSKFIMA